MGLGRYDIRIGDLADPRVVALLETHHAVGSAQTAPGSAHALDVAGLRSPDVALWTIWDGAALVGCGALKRLALDRGEVKSMHTVESRRGSGVGGAMLRHIIATARERGMTRLFLETGTWPFFAPAVAFYRSYGFVACPPFATYVDDPNSIFLTLDLSGVAAGTR